nr:hypothetical protein [uncultured bacterium]
MRPILRARAGPIRPPIYWLAPAKSLQASSRSTPQSAKGLVDFKKVPTPPKALAIWHVPRTSHSPSRVRLAASIKRAS